VVVPLPEAGLHASDNWCTILPDSRPAARQLAWWFLYQRLGFMQVIIGAQYCLTVGLQMDKLDKLHCGDQFTPLVDGQTSWLCTLAPLYTVYSPNISCNVLSNKLVLSYLLFSLLPQNSGSSTSGSASCK
jgi:hypothetical protein